MRWKIRDDNSHAYLIIDNCPVFSIKQKDTLWAFDGLLRTIDRSLVKTDNAGNKLIRKYIDNIITIRIMCSNPLFKNQERNVSEYIELDDYIRIVVSIFDVLNAHQYRKL